MFNQFIFQFGCIRGGVNWSLDFIIMLTKIISIVSFSCFLGYFLISFLNNYVEFYGIIDLFDFLYLFVFSFILFGISIVKLFYSNKNEKRYLIISILLIIISCLSLVSPLRLNREYFESPVISTSDFNPTDFSVEQLMLRKDGNFEIKSSELPFTKYYAGKYKINMDSISLIFSDTYYSNIKSLSGIITDSTFEFIISNEIYVDKLVFKKNIQKYPTGLIYLE